MKSQQTSVFRKESFVMKHFFLILSLVAAPMCLAEQGSKKSAPAKTAAPARPAPAKMDASKPQPGSGSLTLPKDAVEVEPYLWSHKDENGKVWHYRKTPFGLRKFEPETIPSGASDDAAYMKAIDDGDSVRFERKTPFGLSRWSRKKTELTEAEKITYERDVRAAKPARE